HHAVLRVEDLEEGAGRLRVALQGLVADREVVGNETASGAGEHDAVLLRGARSGGVRPPPGSRPRSAARAAAEPAAGSALRTARARSRSACGWHGRAGSTRP